MKVNYFGFDIECTPEEFLVLLNSKGDKGLNLPPIPFPFTTIPNTGGFVKYTCPPVEITCTVDNTDFAKKFAECLNNKGIRKDKPLMM